MCGIAGFLANPNHSPTEDLLRAMGATQHHRGPDHFSVFVEPPVGLAHNRLSIIDLSPTGHQPFQNDRYVLVYNGEIYNYLELRQELETEGATFQGTSDTEVLFEYLGRHGVERTLRAIRGMFAFSFYDRQEKVVYLCRDRLGIKPVVWTQNASGVFWASEAKAIAAATSIEPDPIKTLFATASFGERTCDYTMFRGVRQVRPGTYLVCKQGRPPEQRTYYDISGEFDRAYYNELEGMPFDAQLDTFENLLERSVESMLMSDAPMGVFVSGGIDSSLIATLAATHDPELTLFTADMVGRYSEYGEAQLLSESIGRPLYATHFEPEMMLSRWAQATYHYEVPIVIHTNAMPLAAVAELAHQHGVKPVLTGEGSDEMFFGYAPMMVDRYARLLAWPLRFLSTIYALMPGLRRRLLPEREHSVGAFVERLVQGFEAQTLESESLARLDSLPPARRDDQYRSIHWLRGHLVSLLLRNDRMGMLASIESRFPYLDEDIIRFGINLPARYKATRTWRFHTRAHPFLLDKALVRRLAARRLPPALTRKKKVGFGMFGHRNIRVKEGFFRDGYVADLTGMTARGEATMLRSEPPLFVAKLVSLEIFGRLFERGESCEAVTERVRTWVRMDLTGTP